MELPKTAIQIRNSCQIIPVSRMLGSIGYIAKQLYIFALKDTFRIDAHYNC